MKQDQIELVQRSFALAIRVRAHFAATFYAELFALDPSLRRLFRSDIIAQGQKLVDTLELAVGALEDVGALTPTLEALAIRHLDYGVEDYHYASVRTALIRTLRHELAGALTPEMESAWVAAYDTLAGAMRRAAYGPDRAA